MCKWLHWLMCLALVGCAPPQDQHFEPHAYPALTDVYWFPDASGGNPVVVDSHGNIWIADKDIGSRGPRVELINRQGSLTLVRSPHITNPNAIAIAPDKSVWIANVTSYPEPIEASLTRVWPAPMRNIRLPSKSADVEGIAFETNGSMWFSEGRLNKIGVVKPNGRIVEYRVPSRADPESLHLVDGVLWFSENGENIGAFNLRSKRFTQYVFPSAQRCFNTYIISDGSKGIIAATPMGLFALTNSGKRKNLGDGKVGCAGSIARDTKDNIWFASGEGLKAFNLRDHSVMSIKVPAARVGGLFSGVNGEIWAGIAEEWGFDNTISGLVRVRTNADSKQRW